MSTPAPKLQGRVTGRMFRRLDGTAERLRFLRRLRPTITAALAIVFLLLGLAFSLLVADSWTRAELVNGNLKTMAGKWLPTTQSANELQLSLTTLSAAFKDLASTTDKREQQRNLGTLSFERSRLTTETVRLAQLLQEGDGSKLVDEIRQKLDALDAVSSVFKEPAMDPGVLSQAYQQKIRPLVNDIGSRIKRIQQAAANASTGAYVESQRNFETGKQVALVIAAASLVLILAAVTYAIFDIGRPIRRIKKAMNGLAEGQTHQSIPYLGRDDEIGHMAASVEIFRQAAIAKYRLEEEAEQQRIQAGVDRERLTQEAEEAARRRLEVATSGLAGGLRRLAEGDLTSLLEIPFAAEFEPLRHDFNTAVEMLIPVLSDAVRSADEIESRTSEINAGTRDLATRTEQQARSLRQATERLGELVEHVGLSSTRSKHVLRSASTAAENSARSSESVNDVDIAMKNIQHSSRQITGVLTLLNEITTQTNLLALNASVEAAKAGDVGKGFGVVAFEVRELAQRSAAAAKEIKGLLAQSNHDVANGMELVNHTGASLRSIAAEVRDVTELVGAISEAAQEQAKAISEVSGTVFHVENSARMNMEMVDLAAMTTGRLHQEAARLRAITSKFRLPDGNEGSHRHGHENEPYRRGPRGLDLQAAKQT